MHFTGEELSCACRIARNTYSIGAPFAEGGEAEVSRRPVVESRI